MDDRTRELNRRQAILQEQVRLGRAIEQDDFDWAAMTGPYTNDRPPYLLIHSNVDGAGSIGSFWTLDEARAEADRLQQRADAGGNPWGYHFTVYTGIDRVVYRSTSRPAILKLAACSTCGRPFQPHRPTETQCGPCSTASFIDLARRQ